VWENVICLNRVLLLANEELVMSQTVAHEVAHLVDYALNPQNFTRIPGVSRCSFHGPTWKAIMKLFGRESIRQLEVDATFAQVRVIRKHFYECGLCGALTACGTKAHTQIQNGDPFSAIRCGHAIKPTEYQGLTPETVVLLANRAIGASL
jgi:predicted SprT family Zn-dependent metalloprotease